MVLGKEKGSIRILVVDDDKTLADMLTEFITKLGYGVTAVYTPEEALVRFRQENYSLVITDLMMPGMDGIELLQEIKKVDEKALVLVVTGFGTIESAVKAIKSGAYDFITKPFKLDELEIIIHRCLDRYRLGKQLGVFKGMILALLVSVPIWLILGIILGLIWK